MQVTRRLALVSVFPEAWRERDVFDTFEHYIAVQKKVELAATDLDWVILELTEGPTTIADAVAQLAGG